MKVESYAPLAVSSTFLLLLFSSVFLIDSLILINKHFSFPLYIGVTTAISSLGLILVIID